VPDPLVLALAGVVTMLTAVVAGFLNAMRTGAIMTRKSHDEIVAVYSKTLERTEQAHDLAVAQRNQLMKLTDVTVGIVQAIPRAKDPAG